LDAVINGNADIVQKLINPLNPVEEIAEARHCNEQGLGAIHLAVMNLRVQIFRKLVESDRTLLHMRTEDGRSETPLHLAVKKGNLNLLRLMINEYQVPVVV
jgi:ankyrin repeat protein